MATKQKQLKVPEDEKPITMTGLKGQLLRFGEHNIAHIRKELHAAVDEESRFNEDEKDIRKQLFDKVLAGTIQVLSMEKNLDTYRAVIKEINEYLVTINEEIAEHCGIVAGLESEKRKHVSEIASLKKQIAGEQTFSDELNEEHKKMAIEMEPTKKKNAQLMGIINAAEKGHNLLLNTMQTINNDIAGQL